jgi:c-di-GMP phosphodiesterase
MKVFNFIYEDEAHLKQYIKDHINVSYKSLLIQVFSGELDKSKLSYVLNTLHSELPDAAIIGSSTCGEIIDGSMTDASIALSFSLFDTTTINSYHIEEVNYISGQNFAHSMVQDDTRAIIAFGETYSCDPQNFFEGFDSIHSDVVIAGGNAGDNYNFKETFVIHGNEVFSSGLVLCTLDSKSLNVNNHYSLNWTALGRKMEVTKVHGNVVTEIDNKPILDIYKYYFGDSISYDFPNSVIEFPLLKKENQICIARSVVEVTDDNEFVFAGHFHEGDEVQFSFGNYNDVIKNANKLSQTISKKPAEAIFIYSCSVRKSFLGQAIKSEFESLESIASTVGFFTYGEFFHTGVSNQVLNITTTVLALSESDELKKAPLLESRPRRSSTLESLTHLINVSERELEQKTEALFESSRFAQLGEMVSMIAHQWRQPLSSITACLSSMQLKMHLDRLDQESLGSLIGSMEDSTEKLSSTIDMFSNYLDNSDTINRVSADTVLRETFLLIEDSLSFYKIKVDFEIDKHIVLDINAYEFKKVILSLLKNAQDVLVEHKIYEPKIIIRAFKTDNQISIDVEDNGGGIKSTHLKSIFDPYFTTKQIKNGAGLGLYMSKVIVEQHCRGHLDVINTSDGVCFRISI